MVSQAEVETLARRRSGGPLNSKLAAMYVGASAGGGDSLGNQVFGRGDAGLTPAQLTGEGTG
jgi:hypothetical protein